jgi:hypothetical protein
MTIRTFWTIFIKILGIWLVLSSLKIIPQSLIVLPFFRDNYNYNVSGIGLIVGLLFLTVALYIFVLWLFVFKTAWLIDKLHLDKGFTEEKIELNIKQSSVLAIAVIVVGGLIFVDSFSQLCSQTFEFLKQKNMFMENPNAGRIILQLVKTIIGYLLMTNSKLVIKFIEKQNLKQNDADE